MNRLTLVLLLGMIFVSAAGCGSGGGAPIRVGAKGFAEQTILAHVLVKLLRANGHARAMVEACGDTYACHRAMQAGKLDLMVEYSGTGVTFLGGKVARGNSALPEARRLYKELGLTWLGPLGFDNGYRLLVNSELASALELRTIGHLSRVNRRLRVALPREYLRRPRDGLASLSRRYGLRFASEALIIEDPGRRFRALFQGKADVAVGYATDGVIGRLGLRVLRDPLAFFPPYEAAVMVRDDLLSRAPGMRKLLGKLEGGMDTGTMQRLNYQVQVQGRSPERVAAAFLRSARLIKGKTPAQLPTRELVVAVAEGDMGPMASLVTRGLQAVRAVFPERPAAARGVAQPVARVHDSTARLAILGAERFFARDGARPPIRESRVEALAVLGTRMIHLVRRSPPSDGRSSLSGRVGVPPAGSGGALVAGALLTLSGSRVAMRGTPDLLLDALAQNRLDAVLLLAEAGDARVAERMGKHKLALLPMVWEKLVSGQVTGWLSPEKAVQLPYLRPARIPAGTYPGQDGEVETLGSQVVLAGPARGAMTPAGGGGPAAALPTRGKHLDRKLVEALARATGVPEAPDPVLPSAWSVRPVTGAEQQDQGSGLEVLDTSLNLAAISFVAWLFFLLRRRRG